MTDEERKAHAKRLIKEHNEEYEFCLVYEDEELEDLDPEEQEAILDTMHAARLKVFWDD